MQIIGPLILCRRELRQMLTLMRVARASRNNYLRQQLIRIGSSLYGRIFIPWYYLLIERYEIGVITLSCRIRGDIRDSVRI